MRSCNRHALIFLKMEVGFLIRIYEAKYGEDGNPKPTEAYAQLNSYILSKVSDLLNAKFYEEGEYTTRREWRIRIEDKIDYSPEAHYVLDFGDGNTLLAVSDNICPLKVNYVEYYSCAPSTITSKLGIIKIYAFGSFGQAPIFVKRNIAHVYQQGLKKYFPECFFAVDKEAYQDQ